MVFRCVKSKQTLKFPAAPSLFSSVDFKKRPFLIAAFFHSLRTRQTNPVPGLLTPKLSKSVPGAASFKNRQQTFLERVNYHQNGNAP